jgi:type IV pilus assembly protein PilP
VVVTALLAAVSVRAEEPAQAPAQAPAEAAAPAPAPASPPPAETALAVVPTDLPYDPANRRDPFRPPRVGTATPAGEARTPLQRYDIGQLRLVAIIYDTREPRAVVEDDQGLGYIVKVGTPVGPNGGQVKSIERGKVLIKEDALDFYGERHASEVAMELRTADRGKQ